MTESVQYRCFLVADYGDRLSKALFRLQRENRLCDTTIHAHDGQVRAHSVVLLASECSVFSSLHLDEDLSSHHIHGLQDQRVANVQILMELLYTGGVNFNGLSQVVTFRKLCSAVGLLEILGQIDSILPIVQKHEELNCAAQENGAQQLPACPTPTVGIPEQFKHKLQDSRLQSCLQGNSDVGWEQSQAEQHSSLKDTEKCGDGKISHIPNDYASRQDKDSDRTHINICRNRNYPDILGEWNGSLSKPLPQNNIHEQSGRLCEVSQSNRGDGNLILSYQGSLEEVDSSTGIKSFEDCDQIQKTGAEQERIASMSSHTDYMGSKNLDRENMSHKSEQVCKQFDEYIGKERGGNGKVDGNEFFLTEHPETGKKFEEDENKVDVETDGENDDIEAEDDADDESYENEEDGGLSDSDTTVTNLNQSLKAKDFDDLGSRKNSGRRKSKNVDNSDFTETTMEIPKQGKTNSNHGYSSQDHHDKTQTKVSRKRKVKDEEDDPDYNPAYSKTWTKPLTKRKFKCDDVHVKSLHKDSSNASVTLASRRLRSGSQYTPPIKGANQVETVNAKKKGRRKKQDFKTTKTKREKSKTKRVQKLNSKNSEADKSYFKGDELENNQSENDVENNQFENDVESDDSRGEDVQGADNIPGGSKKKDIVKTKQYYKSRTSVCYFCDELYANMEELKQHYKSTHPKIVKCNKCEETMHIEKYRKHYHANHIFCDMCDYPLSKKDTEIRLAEHKFKVHGEIYSSKRFPILSCQEQVQYIFHVSLSFCFFENLLSNLPIYKNENKNKC